MRTGLPTHLNFPRCCSRFIYLGCQLQDLTVALDIIVRADAKESGGGLMWHINGSPLAWSQGSALLSSAPLSSAQRRTFRLCRRRGPPFARWMRAEPSCFDLTLGKMCVSSNSAEQGKKTKCWSRIFPCPVNKPWQTVARFPNWDVFRIFQWFPVRCQIPGIPSLSRLRPNRDINNPIVVILSCIWTAVGYFSAYSHLAPAQSIEVLEQRTGLCTKSWTKPTS